MVWRNETVSSHRQFDAQHIMEQAGDLLGFGLGLGAHINTQTNAAVHNLLFKKQTL